MGSVKVFCLLNGFHLTISVLLLHFIDTHPLLSMLLSPLSSFLLLSWSSWYHGSCTHCTQQYEFDFYCVSSFTLERVISYHFITSKINKVQNRSIMWFLPISFFFELLFDLLHYTMHRISHENRFLYKHFHSIHHHDKHPTLLTTFRSHPIDLLLTNSIPLWICFSVFPLTKFETIMMLQYKLYVELAGHSGIKTNSRSFPQCNFLLSDWLLQTVDHENHHVYSRCNYSKRFRVWDKVFGTYNKQ